MASRRLFGSVPRHLLSKMIHLSFPSLSSQTLTMRLRISPYSQYTHLNSFTALPPTYLHRSSNLRLMSSRTTHYSGSEDISVEEDDEDEDEGESCYEEDGLTGQKLFTQSGKSEAEKVEEAAEIGYTVVGPLTSSENPFKLYEPAFAVVQIGSHQFKVSNGDSIFTERLKYCEVNDKLILSKVLMLGSRNETIIGRPILPDATVYAVVEEHALDAKVIIFKKKRRKNYRRTKGHRQELTKLRITDVQGIDKSEDLTVPV